jgi:AcrR family transcriptional regulator
MADEQVARLTPTERRDHTRQKVLLAATELFSENGYHRTQVMDIVTKARVSAGTFYRYFDDKQGIFFAIAEELGAHEVEEARKARVMILEAPSLAASVRNMVQFLERHFERVMERARLYRALYNSGVVDGRRDHAWAMRERAVMALAEELKHGPIKDTEDLESLARMIMGVTSELRYAMIHTGKPTPSQAARLVTRFLQGAIAAYSTHYPGYAKLFGEEWREVLDREART